TAAEISLLKEEEYDLSDNGEPRRKRMHLDLARNVRFALKVSARLFNSSFSVQPDEDWKSFVTAVDIKNRLSRPKDTHDLTISDHDLETIDKAHDWYRKVLMEMLRRIRGTQPVSR